MDNQPVRDQRILEAMEACRAGSDDVADAAFSYLADAIAADPKLKDRYDRLQRLDARLAAGFRDVPVPDGLEGRLLERLAAARAAEFRSEQGQSTPQVGPRPTSGSRRWLVFAGGASVAAAGLLAAVLISARGWNEYTESQLLVDAIEFFNSEPAGANRSYVDRPWPDSYPFSRDVLRVRGTRWRKIRGFLGREGVAYDLPGPGRTRATLYVVRGPIQGLPPRAPLAPVHTTAGCSSAAWEADGLLYVLVIRGGRYHDYVPSGTMA